MQNVADYYDVEITFAPINTSDLFIGGPSVSNPIFENIIKGWNAQGIYRVVLPEYSSSLAPFLRGDYAGNVPFEVRFPDTIVAVANPGTPEVENHPNIWRFIDATSAHDTNGTIEGGVYTSNLLPGGKVLLVHTNSGVDLSAATQVASFLPSLGVPLGDIILFPITPAGLDFAPATYTAIKNAINLLPNGSVVAYFVNSPIDGNVFVPSAVSAGGIFVNTNILTSSLTHVGGNFGFESPTTCPVDIQYGLSLDGDGRGTPNKWTHCFGLSDSLQDALNGAGLWSSDYNAVLHIDIVSWLATRGLWQSLDDKLFFVGQSRVNHIVLSALVQAGSSVSTYEYLGHSSWYYDAVNMDVPGTWSIIPVPPSAAVALATGWTP